MEMLQPNSGVELADSRAILLLHVGLLPGLRILPGPDRLSAEPDAMLLPGIELVQDDANLPESWHHSGTADHVTFADSVDVANDAVR